jgi:hypothetical protein
LLPERSIEYLCFPCPFSKFATQPFKVVAVALANKIARIAWKLMVTGESYRAPTSVSVAAGAI